MIQISNALQEFILIYGLQLFCLFTLLYYLSWTVRPSIWSYEMSGGKIKTDTKGYIMYLIILFSVLTGNLVYIDKLLIETELLINQTTLFVVNLLIYGLYCLLHLFINSYIIYIRLQPRIFILNSVKNNYNFMFHVKVSLLLFIYGAVFCFLASVITYHY